MIDFKKIKTCFTILALFFMIQVQAQSYSNEIANQAMEIWKDSFSMNNKPAKWAYEMGVMLSGMEACWMNSGDARFFHYIQKQVDYFVQEDGKIRTYKQEDYNLDNIQSGKQLLMLYKVTQQEKYLRASQQLFKQIQQQPRTASGGFWHKKIYPHQMWLDGLYMAEPFYAEYAALSHQDSLFDDIAKQFVLIDQHCRNPKTDLYYHGWDESKKEKWANPISGCSSHAWARAMGWYASALVDMLDWFPINHPARKQLLSIANHLSQAITTYQDKKTGLWLDVLGYTGPDQEKNYFESSASCQFVYFMAKAARKGYIPKSSGFQVASKGFDGIQNRFIKKLDDQHATLTGTVKVSGLGNNPYRDGSFQYYMSEPITENDPKGMGVYLLAAGEMEKLKNYPIGNGKRVLLDNYFNRETHKDAFGQEVVFHYKWKERDNGGYDFLGHAFEKNGAVIDFLDQAPTAQNLNKASVYILVDPDWPKENKQPHYIEQAHIQALKSFVKKGGVLLLLANDTNNVEFEHFNQLMAQFGIQWNINKRHDVEKNQFEQGAVDLTQMPQIFKHAKKGFIKQLCTQQLTAPAQSLYAENNEVLISMSQLGKGLVFAVGDPWFYNEYVDGRKLPAEYENHEAANDIIKWLLIKAKK